MQLQWEFGLQHINFQETQFSLLHSPKWSLYLMQSLPKSQWHLFSEIEKSILKFMWSLNGSQVVKTMLKKTEFDVSNFLIFKTYFRATSNQNSVVLTKR